MISTEKTRSGNLTLLINKRLIHSRYNPESEAQTFLLTKNFKRCPQIVIIIGSGLGYLKKAVLNKYKDVKVFSIYLDNEIYKLSPDKENSWVYTNNKLKYKLSNFIPDFLLSETRILKWLPCTQQYPHRTKEIEEIIFQFLMERKGSIFTTQKFGKKWIRNFFLNYGKIKSFYQLSEINLPVLIAASGPSLNKAIDFLRKYKNKYILAALPSSLAALNFNGIKPDIILNTDPGYWTGAHFKYLDKETPIVMPLSASFFSNCHNPVICIDQNTFLENIFFKNKHFSQISSHGTVAGTAYLFLRKITDKPIIFAGLDFCFKDIHEHVKPHSYDTLFRVYQNRFNTELHSLYVRKNNFLGNNSYGSTKALTTYSGWFNTYNNHKNIFRLNPSDVKTYNLESIDENRLLQLLNNFSSLNCPFKFNKISDISAFIPLNIGLEEILAKIKIFKKSIKYMNSNDILLFFTNNNLLTEIFQFLEYTKIIELAKIYRSDKENSQLILNEISVTSYNYFNDLLIRQKNE